MDEPVWVGRMVADAVHTNQLQEHGGLQGTRDENALDAALARPQHKYTYNPDIDVAELAAAYAFGLATAHPYVDGNKRTAFVIATIFLELNGFDLDRPEDDVVDTMVAVASGVISESALASWMREALIPLAPPDVETTNAVDTF